MSPPMPSTLFNLNPSTAGINKLIPLTKLVIVVLVLLLSTQAALSWSSWPRTSDAGAAANAAAAGSNETQLKHTHRAQVRTSEERFGVRDTSHKDSAQPATESTADSGHGAKPPRGYCVRISRAIKPASRCYKHLVQGAHGLHHDEQQEGQQPLSKHHKQPSGRFLRAANTQAGTAKVSNLSLSNGSGGNSSISSSRRRLNAQLGGAHHREELVYVRSETLGDKITNLSTQAINEHLINGLLDRLLGPGEPVSGNGDSAAAAATENEKQIRMQILLSLSSECRLAIEKFLCRLVYPSCHFRSIDVVALVRPPCQEDCLLLREHICANLNWTQFSRTIQQAFKATLMSTINALDLLVDGDQSAPPSSLLAAMLRPAPKSSAGLDDSLNSLRNASSNSAADQQRRNEANPASLSWPSSSSSAVFEHNSMNISTSVHFYWPHERSIERCESLPILWPSLSSPPSPQQLPLAHVGADIGRGPSSPSTEKSTLEAKQLRRWLRDHRARNYWPVCSNAHLTETNELTEEQTDASLAAEAAAHETNWQPVKSPT